MHLVKQPDKKKNPVYFKNQFQQSSFRIIKIGDAAPRAIQASVLQSRNDISGGYLQAWLVGVEDNRHDLSSTADPSPQE